MDVTAKHGMGFVPLIDDPAIRFLGLFHHRSVAFDSFVVGFIKLDLFKGAVVIAILCWLWFEFGPDLRRRRILVIQTVLGAALAGLSSHVLQSLLARPHSISSASEFVVFGVLNTSIDWMQPIHSFPSDHAAFFAAIATGIFLANRRWGIFAFIWTLVVIDLPRIYAGAHYPSDVLAGLALGIVVTLAITRPAAVVAEPVLRWEKTHGAPFYAVSFVVLYELARLFEEVRLFGTMLWHSARMVVA
jgi:undecaprenyl-diphosphatase